MFQRIFGAAMFVFVLETISAQAQVPFQFPIESPANLVRDAFAHPYGRALIAEFAKTAIRSADAACLRSKALDEAKLREHGRELFQRYGTRHMEILINNVDRRRLEAKFAERAGANALAEFLELRDTAEAKQYLALERPARLARVANSVVDNFERYVLITRINIKSFSPISTGNNELMRIDPTEATDDVLDKFVKETNSQQFKRFYELSEIGVEAFIEAFNQKIAMMWGPSTYYSGVENDLAEICIIKR